MTKKVDGKEKITIRVSPAQKQVLDELTQALGVAQSLVIRSIICDFITRNNEVLERIISGEQEVNLKDLDLYE